MIKFDACPNILSLFRHEFNKFNNTGGRMLDPISHMTLNYLKIAFLAGKHQYLPPFMQRI